MVIKQFNINFDHILSLVSTVMLCIMRLWLKLTSRLRSHSDFVSLSAMSTTSQGMTSKVMNLYT